MKAAVLNQLGLVPVFREWPEPQAENDSQVVVRVLASAVKNLDKLRAGGKHYASYSQVPVVVGMDGIIELENGSRAYAQGLTGTLAELAVVDKSRVIPVPDQLDTSLAAALPNAVAGAAMAILFRAKMKPGDTILINGATGATGTIAVQVAKHYGAGKIIVTGRNAGSLKKLEALGADQSVSLLQEDSMFIDTIKSIHEQTPIDCIIDYLWGKPVELLIKALKGGGIDNFTHPVKIVTVGEMAGETIELPSGILRSSAIEILGSGLGSLSREEMTKFGEEILPEMYRLASEGKLKLETVEHSLSEISEVWNKEWEGGKRLVIRMN